MKTYIEFKDSLSYNNSYIPKDPFNCDYTRALEEVKKGLAIFEPFVPKNEITWESIKLLRNELLKETDWVGASDATPKPSKEAWLNYRQALRDITETYSSPEAVVWPQKPIA